MAATHSGWEGVREHGIQEVSGGNRKLLPPGEMGNGMASAEQPQIETLPPPHCMT